MNSHKAFRCALSLLLSLVFIITLFPAAFAESGGQPLALRFVCDEAVATVTVYDLYGEAIPVQGDGIHHLAPGTYFYTAEAQGFESQVMQPFMIPADAVGDQEVRLTLTPLSVTAGQDPLPAEGGEQPYAPSRPDNTVSGGIFSARYGKYQVFDVQRDPAYPSGTQQTPEAFSVSALSVPFDLGEVAEDGFFYFIYLGTASQAGVSYSQHWNCGGEGLDPLAVSLHYKEGENDVFLASGIIGAFSAEGFLFASDGRGTWFSNTRGYRYADTVISYTPVENGRVVCDAGLLTSCYVENMQEPAEDAPTHLHNWQTASEKNRATFRCTAENCPYGTDTEYAMILTVAAEEGGPASANVTRRSPDGNWPAELGQDVIRFKGRGETEFAESTAAPSQDGLYTASVSVGYRLDPRILTLDFTVGMIGEETEETEETEPACPHAHTDVRLEVVTAPTCTEEGVYRKITFCTDCEEVLLTEPGTDPSLGHIWSEWEVISEPTPWAEGRKVRSCTREGCEEAEQTTLAALTPFFRSVTADNVVVTVRAPEGVFPADAVLYVQSVPEELRERADAAVAALREEDAEVTSSFTFDVRVLDADGNELRPPEGKEGSVSFSFAEVRGEDAEACIYCLTEQEGALTAEKTDAKTAGDSVTATVSGFSLCHVETTRKVLASTLSGFALRSGSPTDLIVVSSLDDLVRTLNHQSSTDEHAPTVIQLGDTISGEVILEIESGTFVTLDLNGHTLNLGSTNLVIYGSLTLRDSVGGGTLSCYSVVCEGEGSFTMLGGTVDATDVTMNGSFTMLGGTVDTTFVNVNGGSFTMSGGTVTEVDVYPGGSFTMSGGTVTSVEVYSGSSFTMSGGTVSNPEGYGIIVYGGTVNLSGDPAITGKVAGIYFTYLAPTINITGPLRNADKISIGMFAPGVFTAGYGTHNTADPSTVFTSAAEGYEVVKNADGEAELRQRVVTYPLWVGGVQVTSANASAVTGDGISGTVSYDRATKTLTLENATITGKSFIPPSNIYSDGEDLKIKLVGTNTLSVDKNGVGITIRNAGLTITGDSLCVGDSTRSSDSGICAATNITIENCGNLEVFAATLGLYSENNLSGHGGSITIADSKVTVKGEVCGGREITVTGNSTVHAVHRGGEGAVCVRNKKGTINIGAGLSVITPVGGVIGKPDGWKYIYDGDEIAKEVLIAPGYTVSVNADPAAGGTVSGGGAYSRTGATATLTATPAAGGWYRFKNWTENGSVAGTENPYSFPVTGDRTLTANFEFGVEIYAAGNGDGNWLNGAAWDTGYASNKLTETAPGIYQITFENVGEGFGRQVKFAVDKVWTKNFGSDGQFTVGECCNAVPNGDNITFDTDGLCDVTLTLDLTQFDPETGKGATYKVEIGGRHTHSFAYTANGAQVTAKCVGSGDCPEGYQSNGITLTLNAPAELTYDGTAKAATLSGYPATPPANLAAAPTGISYYKSAGAGSTTPSGGALSGAPADAGDYVAQFTWGDETASLAFTVAKREVTVKAEDAADVTYNGSKQVGNTAVTFSNVVSGHTATITYTPAEGTLASVTPYSGSYGTDFAVTDRGGLDVTANYDLKTQTPGKLTITPSTKALVIASPSNSWEYDDDVHTDEAYTVTYDGQAVQPDDTGKVFTLPTGDTVTVTPTASGVKNVSDTAENNNTYTYVLTNEGCYSSVTANTGTLSITPKQLSDGMLTFDSVVTAPADGKAHGPAITLADGTAALEAGKDYTLSGETQSAVFGEHSFTVAGTGNYTGELKDNTWTLKGDAGGTLTYGVQEEAGAPVTVTWVNQSADLARSLLTDGERTSLDLYDTPTAVFVKIAPPDDPSGEDARKLEALAKKRGEKIGVTMEITLWVYSGNEKPRQITDTGGKPITLKIEIPAGLRNAPDGYSRSFSLLTVHNGEAKVVASGSGSSFTQSLTEFSPYAVSYWDTELPRGASPRTGDNNNLALWLALAAVSAAGCAALAVTGKKRKRK